jgi:hypothetical protein
MLEEVGIDLQRDGRIGVPEPMLNLGDWRSGRNHRRCAAMAKGMEGYSAKASSGQGGIEGDSKKPIAAYRLSFGIRKHQILSGDGASQLPPLQIGNKQGRN